jgi:hypothetical protein
MGDVTTAVQKYALLPEINLTSQTLQGSGMLRRRVRLTGRAPSIVAAFAALLTGGLR